MDNIWNLFKQRTLEVQHVFNNLLVQSYNQSTYPRENMILNEMEDQQMNQAMALSMGQNVREINNYSNDIFPPPLPQSPHDYIREQNMQEMQDEMQDEQTPYEDDEEMLNIALRESLNESKERDDSTNNNNSDNNNNNRNSINNGRNIFDDSAPPIESDNLDDIGQVIMQIRKERSRRKSQDQRQRLMREQEEAYEESLQQDNLKKLEEQKKIQEQQQMEQEMQIKREMEEAIQLSKELSKKNKIEKVMDNIPLEPSKSEKDSVEIVVRLTDGTKVSRRFRQDNTLQHLHNWITSLSEEKSIPDLFSISSSFPRKKFSDLQLTFKDAGLVGSVLLFIEEEDEDEN